MTTFPYGLRSTSSSILDRASDSLLDQSVPGVGSPDEEINSWIGPYKIREKIGEGGMGIVYVAEQSEPVQRKVALKVIKPGMDTKDVIARFEAERQALAFMEHPNIARVLDAGATETGRSYFVMELVRGIPITEYCDQLKLKLRERLELFMTVCDAVQHAHQKGIIHRDIKPSNVLITQISAKPVVKVIDFGLAKATSGQRLTDKTVYTAFMRLMGTPLYMSPEQAGLSGLDVDTRSDIYSLGILLYELLTGTTPLDKTEIQQKAYDELCRQIREVEAPKPSARISTLREAQRSTIAQHRQIDPKHLRQLLHGDLDRVVLKAIEKDRDQRYETSKDLAADIERFLSDQPVQAVPPSQLYLARKYFRRHKVTILTITAVFALSILATAGSSWLALNLYWAKVDQSHLREVAENSALAAQHMAYTSSVNLAKNLVDQNRLGQAYLVLEHLRPPKDQTDLRGFEWSYLRWLCKPDDHHELCDLEQSIYSLSHSYDGKMVAMGAFQSGRVTVWDQSARESVKSWPSTGQRSLVAFSPVEAILAFSTIETTADRTVAHVVLFDFATECEVAKLPLDGRCVALKFAENGRKLVTASATPNEVNAPGKNVAKEDCQGQLCIWDIPKSGTLAVQADPFEPLLTRPAYFRANKEAIPFAATDDLSLAAYGFEQNVHVIDLATGDEIWNGQASQSSHVIALQFSPDGKMLASSAGYEDSNIILWECRSGNQIQSLQGHRGWVGDLFFWTDGKTLASCSADQTICLWDLDDLGNVPSPRILRGHADEVWRLAVLPDGETLLSGSRDGVLLKWDCSVANKRTKRIELPVQSVAFGISERRRSIITVDSQGAVTELSGPDFQNTKPRMNFNKALNENCAVFLLSGNDERLAIRAADSSVVIYDLRRGRRIHEIGITAGRLIGFVDKGNRLLATDPDENKIVEWDLSNGQQRRYWPMPGSKASNLLPGSFVVSPDQRFFAFARSGGELLLCDLQTGKKLKEDLQTTQIQRIAISPDNQILAVGNGLGETKLFKINTDMTTLEETASLTPAGGLAMSFSPDGRRLATMSQDGLTLWDLGLRSNLELPETHRLALLKLDCDLSPQCEFSPDGTWVTARTWKGNLNIWQAAPWSEIERSGTP